MARQYEREEMNPFMDLEAKWAGEDALAPLVEKYNPKPMEVASAEPQSVQESGNLVDKAYDLLGYKSGKGKYKNIEVGASPAHPLLQQFGLVDPEREQQIQELMEAQTHIRDMVLKASKKKIDNLINPKDISDPNVPAGIKPTMDQTMAGFPKPTFDLPDVSTPQSSPLYPENQTLPQPRGPMNDLQEALMSSYIGGHLMQNGGNMEPTSYVASVGKLVDDETQRQRATQTQGILKDYGLDPAAVVDPADTTASPDALNTDPVDVTGKRIPLRSVPASMVNETERLRVQTALKAGKQGEMNKPSNLGRLISERSALLPGDPNIKTYDNMIEKETSVSSIDAENQISRGVFNGSVNSIGNAPITAAESHGFARQGYQVPVGVRRQQAIEMASRQRAELIQRAGLVAKVDIDQTYKPLDKDSQLWRNAETGEAARPNMTPAEAKNKGYINIEPQQLQTVTQIHNVEDGLDSVSRAANKLLRNATGYTLLDAPAGILQSSWLTLKRKAGDKDLAELESAISRITPGMAKLGGDTGNVAVAEREIYGKSIFSDNDTIESVMGKLGQIRQANANTLKSMGMKPKQGGGDQQQSKPDMKGRIDQLLKDGKSKDEIKQTLKTEGY